MKHFAALEFVGERSWILYTCMSGTNSFLGKTKSSCDFVKMTRSYQQLEEGKEFLKYFLTSFCDFVSPHIYIQSACFTLHSFSASHSRSGTCCWRTSIISDASPGQRPSSRAKTPFSHPVLLSAIWKETEKLPLQDWQTPENLSPPPGCKSVGFRLHTPFLQMCLILVLSTYSCSFKTLVKFFNWFHITSALDLRQHRFHFSVPNHDN